MNPDEVRSEWAGRTGEFSPEYYAYRGADTRSEAVRSIVGRHLGKEVSVLELGCNSGRHLAHLADAGFRNLAGIEVNESALGVLREAYPKLAELGDFQAGSFEEILPRLPDGAYDVVYSVETLQHIHPEASWVFAEVARITGELLVTIENESTDGGIQEEDVTYVDEGLPLYHRNWKEVFRCLGFAEMEWHAGDRNTIRAFRPTPQEGA
jgi:SAM-dependent methyltransferase